MVDREMRLWGEEKSPMHVHWDGHSMESGMASFRDIDRRHS